MPAEQDSNARPLFVRDVHIRIEEGLAHLIGNSVNGDQIVSHLVMSDDAFRRMLAEGRGLLTLREN